jgi:hypothetical protein
VQWGHRAILMRVCEACCDLAGGPAMALFWACKAISKHATRAASGYDARRNVLRDDAPGADHCPGPYCHAPKNNRAGADPDPVADYDRTADPLSRRPLCTAVEMCASGKQHPWREIATRTDLHFRTASDDQHFVSQERIRSNRNRT